MYRRFMIPEILCTSYEVRRTSYIVPWSDWRGSFRGRGTDCSSVPVYVNGAPQRVRKPRRRLYVNNDLSTYFYLVSRPGSSVRSPRGRDALKVTMLALHSRRTASGTAASFRHVLFGATVDLQGPFYRYTEGLPHSSGPTSKIGTLESRPHAR